MKVNWVTFTIAVLYSLAETSYFGGNLMPQSPEEVMADGISLIILVMSYKNEKTC